MLLRRRPARCGVVFVAAGMVLSVRVSRVSRYERARRSAQSSFAHQRPLLAHSELRGEIRADRAVRTAFCRAPASSGTAARLSRAHKPWFSKN